MKMNNIRGEGGQNTDNRIQSEAIGKQYSERQDKAKNDEKLV